MVSEKEFAVINEIHKNHLPDQRTIADRTGISLGLTNLIIKRLIEKGYIKAKQLNKKKIQYLLTPKGFSEKASKSYNFTLKTIGMLKSVRERIQEFLKLNYDEGFNDFVITGSGDILDLCELAIKNLDKLDLKYSIDVRAAADNSQTVMVGMKKSDGTVKSVDLLEFLSETGSFYW